MAASSPMVNRSDTTPTERHAAPSHGPPPRHALFRPEHIKVPICHLAVSQHASTMRAAPPPPQQQQQTARPIERSAVQLKGWCSGQRSKGLVQHEAVNLLDHRVTLKAAARVHSPFPLVFKPALLQINVCWCSLQQRSVYVLCFNNVHVSMLSKGKFLKTSNRT